MKIKKFFNPPYTTKEMESASPRKWEKYGISISDMLYDRIGYPVRTNGVATNRETKMKFRVVWNEHGEAFADGVRVHDCDLVRKNQGEYDSASLVCFGLVGIILVVLLSILIP